MEALFGRRICYTALPDPPVSTHANLSFIAPLDADADGGAVDRLSLLPDALLANIVARLPVKDAARTPVLSRRWGPIWRAAPLVVVDTHLLPAADDEVPKHLDRASSAAVADAVSRILAAHPGPFRCVRLACCYMDEHRSQLERWLQLLAAKGVQELFLMNRPSRLDTKSAIPDALFSMADLTCLYLGFWRFPDRASLPRGATFLRLRELGLCRVYIESKDLEFVLSRSPVLETLCFESLLLPLQFRLKSKSLRCLQAHGCKLKSIAVVDAPCLERLFLHNYPPHGSNSRIKIGNAPVLRFFGQFQMQNDELQVGNTIIKAGTAANPSVTVPAVKTLDVQVQFGVRSDAKMLPSFLGCFPNVETLHIHLRL